MDKTPAHCPDDQKIIDDLSKRIDEQDRIIHELQENYRKIKKEFDEYRVRHPENVGVKNGKSYEYKSESKNASETDPQATPGKRPGAVKGHRGYHRPVPDHVDEERKVSTTQCPHCRSDLSDPVETRTRIMEDIPVIRPTVIRYTIERRYCPKCKRIVEPEINDALPNASHRLTGLNYQRYSILRQRISISNRGKTYLIHGI